MSTATVASEFGMLSLPRHVLTSDASRYPLLSLSASSKTCRKLSSVMLDSCQEESSITSSITLLSSIPSSLTHLRPVVAAVAVHGSERENVLRENRQTALPLHAAGSQHLFIEAPREDALVLRRQRRAIKVRRILDGSHETLGRLWVQGATARHSLAAFGLG